MQEIELTLEEVKERACYKIKKARHASAPSPTGRDPNRGRLIVFPPIIHFQNSTKVALNS
jgi:hypothetical protein